MNSENNYFADSVLLRASEDGASLYLYGVIGRWCEIDDRDFAGALRLIDGKPLTVYLNSPGGDVVSAQAIREQLARHDGPVEIHIEGMAASAATLITCARGARVFMSKGALFMVHAPMLEAGLANASELRRAIKMLDRSGASMVSVYSEKTGLKTEELIELMEAETYMTAAEALAYGFIDEIEEPRVVASSQTDDKARVLGFKPRAKMKEAHGMRYKLFAKAAAEDENKKPADAPVDAEELEEEAPAEDGGQLEEEAPAEDEEAPAVDAEELEEEAPAEDGGQLEEEAPAEDEEEADPEVEKVSASVRARLMALGAKKERRRIQEIDEATLPGFEVMAHEAKYKKPVSAARFALAQIKAEKQKGGSYLKRRAAESETIATPAASGNHGPAQRGQKDLDKQVKSFVAMAKNAFNSSK